MCLWDGCARPRGAEFCSEVCSEQYDEWIARQEAYDEEHVEVVSEPYRRADPS